MREGPASCDDRSPPTRGTHVAPLRFCLYQYAHHPLPVLEERWRRAEELGFDVLWNCDTLNEPDHPGMAHFEATSILAAMALRTSTIRVGTLVTTLVYRNPAVIAKAAMTIDHLSGGRLELGFGAGVMETDHEAAGVPWWPGAERVARFAEAVRIVDGMLRYDDFSSEGTYHSVRNAEMAPRPVQRPRPPLTIPAHGRSMLRVAAEMADAWSSWGAPGSRTRSGSSPSRATAPPGWRTSANTSGATRPRSAARSWCTRR